MKVYTASKLNKKDLWIELARDWTEIQFTARWPVKHVGTVPDDPCFAKVFWVHDEEDVAAADVVLVYAEPEDKLKGALVEAGMAIATGKHVIVVGEHPDYGTWQYHPRVHRVKSLDDARLLLLTMGM
jgi:nucleoside 2-deoxyribosyltransferase